MPLAGRQAGVLTRPSLSGHVAFRSEALKPPTQISLCPQSPVPLAQVTAFRVSGTMKTF